MVWVIETPTAEQGAELTGLTPEQWQLHFNDAYFRGNAMDLNWLGVDLDQLRDCLVPRNWGSILELVTAIGDYK